MKPVYLVTGASGHLGSAICALLSQRNETVRAFVLPGEPAAFLEQLGVEVVRGDVRNVGDVENFINCSGALRVIHAAGVVDILSRRSKKMEEVNIGGTRNLLSVCRTRGVERFVYVSSVHAIPELQKGLKITETKLFSSDFVVGAYAKTKAETTAMVLSAAAEGFPAVIVHPSGIIGPLPGRGNHLVQLVKDYVSESLKCVVRGGYDFVDVRDVAIGCVGAVDKGVCGETYILANRFYELKDMMAMLREITGGRKVTVFPLWVAKMMAPAFALSAKRRRQKPLFTKYSLYTLQTNGLFSHEKATRELDFIPRNFFETLKDTVAWLISSGDVSEGKRKKRKFNKKAET